MKAGDLIQVKNYVSGGLNIACNFLTSLERCPEQIIGSFNCSNNYLTSLEGCPEKITDYFSAFGNLITSFEHFPKYIGYHCYIGNNRFTSFKDIDQHIEYIGNKLFVSNVNITYGYSDLFGIDGLQGISIDNFKIQNIVNTYLLQKDLINFQDEMIKSGYESYL